jgi:LytS/YehU family sensor histidine kinase
MVAAAIVMVHSALWVGIELWLVPYDFMNPTEFGPRYSDVLICQLPLELLLYGLVLLAFHLRETAARERERERRAAQLETSLAEARLQALRLQLQPHFLFNTLNGVSSLVRAGQNQEAIGMIGGLSELLRYSLERPGGSLVSLEEEAAMIERYLEIQRLRFTDRLAVEMDLPEAAKPAMIPVLLLQPLVENAIRHGISQNDRGGRITVRARREAERLRIEVFNTGRLDPTAPHGIGLTATTSRLAQTYGDTAQFELFEQEDGVLARVSIPWSTAA